jgi:hypothetical protein
MVLAHSTRKIGNLCDLRFRQVLGDGPESTSSRVRHLLCREADCNGDTERRHDGGHSASSITRVTIR